MDNKLEKLLNQIGINEDYMDCFNGSFVKEVVIDKVSNSFNFIINMNNIPHIDVYNDFLTCLKEQFSALVNLTFYYDGDDYNTISSYINNIIKGYAADNLRYNVFIDRDMDIDGKNVIFYVFNKNEEFNIDKIKEDIVSKLRVYGFKDVSFEIRLDKERENAIKNRIEEDKKLDA